MLTYTFDNLHGSSMYMHLYNCIKQDILNSNLKCHDKLPSKRTFAKHLGISLITVENAYAQLLTEGYIYSLPKKGYFVAELPNQTIPEQKTAVTINLPEKPKFFADFSQSSIPMETFPYAAWSKLLRQTLAANNKQALLTDTSTAGLPVLRQAITDYLYQFKGVNIDPNQIIVGAGTQILCNILIQLLGQHNIVALEDPCYPQISKIYQSNNMFCCHLPLDAGGINTELVYHSNANILHITPSHQFPTGIIMPASRRYELLHWAKQKTDRYIIEDDYDGEFRLCGQPIPTLQSIDHWEKVIYMNTFSKTLAPTFRISYMILPAHLAELFYRKLNFYACTVSNIEQLTLAAFIQEGYLERHINRMKTYYRSKRDFIAGYLLQALKGQITILEADAGLHFLLKLNTEKSDTEILQTAHKNNIDIRFISQYYQQQCSNNSHTILINYAGLPDKNLQQALDLLIKIIKDSIA